jgi:P-type Ca2+ transporter type 2C
MMRSIAAQGSRTEERRRQRAEEPDGPVRGREQTLPGRRTEHSLPKRVTRARVELPGLFGNPERAAQIERALGNVRCVCLVRASARTGRVLVVVAGDAVPREVLAAVSAHGVSGAPPPPSVRRALADAAAGARVLFRQLRAGLPRRNKGPAAADADRPAMPAWHAIPAEAVALMHHLDPQAGLTSAEVKQVRERVGANVLTGIEPRSQLQILADQIFTAPTALLTGAAGLSLLLGDVLEAGAIVAVVGANAVIGYYTESRAEELLHAWGNLRVEWARVLRGGRTVSLAASELVPGDLLLLRAGEAIAADARLLSAHDLTMDESMLTGESEPAEKSAAPVAGDAPLVDRQSMVYAGTIIASGHGRAIVVATGQGTELGNIQRALLQAEDRAAPLEQELGAIGGRLARLALASSAAVVGIGLLRGQPLRALAKSAVALGVAAIPEGFPAVGTTALALASRKLYRRGIVIRRLAAAETLGAVSVVCADKTGTLTENRMRVAELFLPGEGIVRVSWEAAPEGAADEGGRAAGGVALLTAEGSLVARERVHELARIAALNADVEIADGKVVRGSGTEVALVEFALAVGYPVGTRRRTARRVGEERRSAERLFMVTVHDHPELGRIELVKGAPEHVLRRCPLSDEARAEALRQNEAMACRGLRVLSLAWRSIRDPRNDAQLSFTGLVGLRDPARPGVREALAALSDAGITTLILTGDQEQTAVAIGESLGIRGDAIYSRVTPEAKLEIVRDLQARGRIVAMTGDGVNDGPALKAADVGVAMGRRGTDIARAVADVVLADDDLPSLTEAVREGRRLYDNVRRAIDYFVATNSSEVLVTLAGAVIGIEPLKPLQLLWINILTDVVPALALALEPSEPDAMRRGPRDPRAPLFGPADFRRIGLAAARMAGVSLAAYGFGAARGSARSRSRTMAFTALVVAQLLHTYACRAGTASTLPKEEGNPHMRRALVGTFALQAGALSSPSLRHLVAADRLTGMDLAVSVALGVLPGMLQLGPGLLCYPGREIVVRRAALTERGESGEVPVDEAGAEAPAGVERHRTERLPGAAASVPGPRV